MDRETFKNIVHLAKVANELNAKSHAAFKAYTSATAAAYAEQAILSAKEIYQGSAHSLDFEQTLTNHLNDIFKTNFSVDDAGSFGNTAAAVPNNLDVGHFASGTPAELQREAQPLKDLFTADEDETQHIKQDERQPIEQDIEGEQDAQRGWQSRED